MMSFIAAGGYCSADMKSYINNSRPVETVE